MLSIICNTYNHEKYIQQCIEGFLIQKTTFPIEILIHDDCSTDNTPKIIREYETKYPSLIKPIYSKENLYSQGKKNILRQRQYGRATGIYIAHCEGDDYWTDPYKLQKQVDFLEANTEYMLTCHRCVYFYENLNRFISVHDEIFSDKNSRELTIENFLDPFLIEMNSVVYRNKQEILSKTHKGYKDIFLYAKLLEKGKGICFKEQMSVYRNHDNGVWTSLWNLSNEIELIKHNLKTSYSLNKYFKFKIKSIDDFCYYTHKNYIFRLIEQKKPLLKNLIPTFRLLKHYRKRLSHNEINIILKNLIFKI